MAATVCLRHERLQMTLSRLIVQLLPRRSVASLSSREGRHEESELPARSFDQVPGPKRLPFLGSLNEFSKEGGYSNVHKMSAERFKKYGSIFKETILGRTVVHLNDKTAVESLLRSETSGGKFPKRQLIDAWALVQQESGIPVSLFNTRDEEGQRLRKVLSPKMMAPRSVHENMDNFNSVTSDLVERFKSLTGTNSYEREINDLKYHLLDWAAESVATFVFDMRTGLFENPPCEESRQYVLSVGEGNIELFPQLFSAPHFQKFIKTAAYKKLVELYSTVVGIHKSNIKKKLRELDMDLNSQETDNIATGSSLLSYVVSKKELTPAEIISNISEMGMAGVDTTAYTTQWLLYHLSKNPDVQERLFQEVDPLLEETGFLSVDDLSIIPYLRACLKESQRLYPLAFGVSRITQQDMVLCGFEVPSASEILYHNYAAGRDEKNFTEAGKFKPERWLGEEGKKIEPFTLLPFGYGPRMCIGKRIAEVEIYSLVSKMIKTFKLSHSSEDVKSVVKFFLLPDRPIKLTLTDRH